MRRICMVCGIMYGLKEPLDDDSETNGLCEECLPLELDRIAKKVKELKEVGFLKKPTS